MKKTRAEIQREYRERKRSVVSHLDVPLEPPASGGHATPPVAEIWRMVQELDGYRRAQEARIQALEDRGALPPTTTDVRYLSQIEALKQRIEEVVARPVQRQEPIQPPQTQTPLWNGQDPATLRGAALLAYVKKFGPVPTAYGDLEPS
jgi:hypothetical protein